MFIVLNIFFCHFIQYRPIQVAWLYNIRGNDVAYCPVAHAFAIVTSNSAFIYVDKQKVSIEVSSRNLIYDLSFFRLGGANLEIQNLLKIMSCAR